MRTRWCCRAIGTRSPSLSGDDTFTAPSSQLYMYLADTTDAIWADKGSLWAFRVTHDDDGKVNAANPFNEANDYGDIFGR